MYYASIRNLETGEILTMRHPCANLARLFLKRTVRKTFGRADTFSPIIVSRDPDSWRRIA